MSTLYSVFVTRWKKQPDNSAIGEVIANLKDVPGWEVSAALKQLIKTVHESPPPVVLEGQESML